MNWLFIVLDVGVNLLYEVDYCLNIFYYFFYNLVGLWLFFKMVIDEGIKYGGMVIGYYDGGYFYIVVLMEGFVCNGGSICFNFVIGFKIEIFLMSDLNVYLEKYFDSVLLMFFSGDFV